VNVPARNAGALEDQPIVVVQGEHVGLGPMRRDLIPLYTRWINDPALVRTTALIPPITIDQETATYERIVTSEQVAYFTIYERSTARPIGWASFDNISPRQRTAEFNIAIGEGECRGKGYGTEATRLMLDYAFTVLGLHNVELFVYEYNLAGQRAYAKAGFREYGRRRQAHRMGGRAWDVVCMDCLADEFESPVLGAVFIPDQAGA
jgi:diamine N-acetyltransferase